MAQEQDTAAGSVPTMEELLGRALLENASYVLLRFLDRLLNTKNPFFFFSFWPHRAACGILIPGPGIEPTPPAVEARES